MIDSLIKACSQKYQKTGPCPDCGNECQGGCEQCLDAIHFSRVSRAYDCSNIALFYICKYVYKYSSEIDRLFSLLKSLRSYDQFNVLSIGCGPCTELVGILRNIDRCKYDKKISYVGFDMNPVWVPIHEFYKREYAHKKNINLSFYYEDACKAKLKFNTPNILILQYVISDMVKSGVEVKKFIDNLMGNVVCHMPKGAFIVLNDINHNKKARDYFDYFEEVFTKRYQARIYKGHFRNNNKTPYSYGNLHASNDLTCGVPSDVREKFHPWEFCSSAHLVIRKDS